MNIFEKKFLMLKPSEIKLPRFNLRTENDSYKIILLSQSISSVGIVEPLIVRKNEEGNFELVSGYRRLKAAEKIGLRRVPCIVEKIDEEKTVLLFLAENISRESLSFFEVSDAIKILNEKYLLNNTEISLILGMKKEEILNKLRFSEFEEELKLLMKENEISENIAQRLFDLDNEKRYEAVTLIGKRRMSEGEAENYIKELLNCKEENIKKEEIKNEEIKTEEKKPLIKSSIGDIRLFSNSLLKMIETLKNSGILVNLRKSETEKYTEYRIRIKNKPQEKLAAEQLKIC